MLKAVNDKVQAIEDVDPCLVWKFSTCTWNKIVQVCEKGNEMCVWYIYLHHLENSTSLADHHDTLRHFLFFFGSDSFGCQGPTHLISFKKVFINFLEVILFY